MNFRSASHAGQAPTRYWLITTPGTLLLLLTAIGSEESNHELA
jgi:hypothetical protein